MSLKDELEKKKTSSRKWIWIIAWCLLLGGAYWGFRHFQSSSNEAVVASTPTEYTVRKWDITLGLTAEWTLQGSNTLALGFESSGKIQSIKKHIGEAVKTGEVIAVLDATQAKIDFQKAQNSLAQAERNYTIKVQPLSDLKKQQIEGTLAMNQIDYENKILGYEQDIDSAEKTIADLERKLQGYQDDLTALIGENSTNPGSTNEKEFMTQVTDAYQSIKENLVTIDEFLWASQARANLNDSYEYIISARNPANKEMAQTLWLELNEVHAPTNIVLSQEMIDYTLADISKMKKLAAIMVDIMDATLKDTSALANSTITSYRSTFSSMYTSMSSKYTTIANSLESDADQKRSIEQQIAQAKADMEYQNKQIALKKKEIEQSKISNEQSFQNSKIDYELKMDPLSNDEKILAQLQLESARITVQEKQIALNQAQLKSPVDGVVLTIDGHVGEAVSGTFVTIATAWYTYVESSISEDEIESIKVGQKATITPTALPDAAFEGEVYYVATVGDTDNNGIVTYKVFIKYTSEDARLRTAMNVDIAFVNKQAKDVLLAPIKAVFPYENTPHVLLKDGTYKAVITGLSDGKQTEIISGVQEGDVLLIQ